jgi:hypothetical protein
MDCRSMVGRNAAKVSSASANCPAWVYATPRLKRALVLVGAARSTSWSSASALSPRFLARAAWARR